MGNLDLHVVPGQIKIRSVDAIIDTPDVLVLQAHLGSRTPGTSTTWCRSGQVGVDVFAWALTKDAGRTSNPTTFLLPEHIDGKWMVLVDRSPERLWVVAIRDRPGGRTEIWKQDGRAPS